MWGINDHLSVPLKKDQKPAMNLWHVMEKDNRMLGTLTNSSGEKNFPGKYYLLMKIIFQTR